LTYTDFKSTCRIASSGWQLWRYIITTQELLQKISVERATYQEDAQSNAAINVTKASLPQSRNLFHKAMSRFYPSTGDYLASAKAEN